MACAREPLTISHPDTHSHSHPPPAGAVGTTGCDCAAAYAGAPPELQDAYRLSCEFCETQAAEVQNVPLPGLNGTCVSCLYSGPVPGRCPQPSPSPLPPATEAPAPVAVDPTAPPVTLPPAPQA